jgi:hypothetical protein
MTYWSTQSTPPLPPESRFPGIRWGLCFAVPINAKMNASVYFVSMGPLSHDKKAAAFRLLSRESDSSNEYSIYFSCLV